MDNFLNQFDTLIFSKKSHLPISEDEGFGIYFSKAIMELACDNRLNKLDLRLMLFLMACLCDKRFKKAKNSVDLLTGDVYAKFLENRKQNISTSLKRLEEYNYIKVDKTMRKVVIINPRMIYADKFKEYAQNHNGIAHIFDLNRIEDANRTTKYQDWSSDIPKQLKEKREQRKKKKFKTKDMISGESVEAPDMDIK